MYQTVTAHYAAGRSQGDRQCEQTPLMFAGARLALRNGIESLDRAVEAVKQD
jgi:hypothetical protein